MNFHHCSHVHHSIPYSKISVSWFGCLLFSTDESISEAYAEGSVSGEESEAASQSFSSSTTTGDGETSAVGNADAGTEISPPKAVNEPPGPVSSPSISYNESSGPDTTPVSTTSESSGPESSPSSTIKETSGPESTPASTTIEPSQSVPNEETGEDPVGQQESADMCEKKEDCEDESTLIEQQSPAPSAVTNTTDTQVQPTNSSVAAGGSTVPYSLEPSTENPKSGDKDDQVLTEEATPSLPPIESCGGNLVCIAKLKWEARKQLLSSAARKGIEGIS